MIKIDFNPPTTDAWNHWRAKCDLATQAVIELFGRGEPIEFTDLYKEQKPAYMSIDGAFHGKCVYCESLISADQPGDLDHFRPKGRVTDAAGNAIMVSDGHGHDLPHPGYYWLAYDWSNLLASCEDCNRPSRQKTKGARRIGKWDQFPVRGTHAANPGEELAEQPLLINPTNQDPAVHISVDDTGVFGGKTDEGKTCIDIFGLNDRDALVDSRIRMYRDTMNKILALAVALHFGCGDKATALLKELKEIKEGRQPYTAAARVAIQEGGARLEPLFQVLSQN